jgi:uncharacterized DUF497 family protein
MAYSFEWDSTKARSNFVRHGINFDEASTVFDDPLGRIFDDESHSAKEKREIIIGHSINDRILIVCFTERPNETIRIISARTPTRQERTSYEENIES